MSNLTTSINLTTLYEIAQILNPAQPPPEVYAKSFTQDGTALELRRLVLGNVAWTEQHIKTHDAPDTQKYEVVTCLPLPNEPTVLDSFRPVVYSNCDHVFCDCNKDWPWLAALKRNRHLMG